MKDLDNTIQIVKNYTNMLVRSLEVQFTESERQVLFTPLEFNISKSLNRISELLTKAGAKDNFSEEISKEIIAILREIIDKIHASGVSSRLKRSGTTKGSLQSIGIENAIRGVEIAINKLLGSDNKAKVSTEEKDSSPSVEKETTNYERIELSTEFTDYGHLSLHISTEDMSKKYGDLWNEEIVAVLKKGRQLKARVLDGTKIRKIKYRGDDLLSILSRNLKYIEDLRILTFKLDKAKFQLERINVFPPDIRKVKTFLDEIYNNILQIFTVNKKVSPYGEIRAVTVLYPVLKILEYLVPLMNKQRNDIDQKIRNILLKSVKRVFEGNYLEQTRWDKRLNNLSVPFIEMYSILVDTGSTGVKDYGKLFAGQGFGEMQVIRGPYGEERIKDPYFIADIKKLPSKLSTIEQEINYFLQQLRIKGGMGRSNIAAAQQDIFEPIDAIIELAKKATHTYNSSGSIPKKEAKEFTAELRLVLKSISNFITIKIKPAYGQDQRLANLLVYLKKTNEIIENGALKLYK